MSVASSILRLHGGVLSAGVRVASDVSSSAIDVVVGVFLRSLDVVGGFGGDQSASTATARRPRDSFLANSSFVRGSCVAVIGLPAAISAIDTSDGKVVGEVGA